MSSQVIRNTKEGAISLFNCWPLFVMIFLSLFYIFLILPKTVALFNKDFRIKIFFMIHFLLNLLFITGCFYCGRLESAVLFTILALVLSLSSVQIHEFLKSRQTPVIKILVDGILMIITAINIFYHVELLTDASGSLEAIYLLENIVLYIVIELLFYLLTRKIVLAVSLTFFLSYGYATINYYVTYFRGSPIIPADFFTIRTAGNVALNYHYEITWNMFRAMVCGMFWILIVGYLTSLRRKDSKREVLSWTFPLVFLTSTIISTNSFSPSLDLWNPKSNIQTYGLAVSLFAGARQMNVAPPSGYSHEKVKLLYNEYIAADEESKNTAMVEAENHNPHIIAIMNESFSDLSVLAPTLDSYTCLPYYHSLSGNIIKGQMLISAHGGGTANTEYEFLTGNTIGFIPGTIPYQQFVLPTSPALPKLLKMRGYQTIAIHPYDKSGYGRDRTYPFLGFDEFLDIRAFETGLPKIRDRYLPDADSYHKIIEVFEQKKGQNTPIFIFNVTMQNHGDYLSGYYGNDTVKIPQYEGQFPDVEEYLTLLRESDAAISILIDYFSRVQEPVVLIFFGDHQPGINVEFYETFMGKPMGEWTLNELQKQFEVPFFIWANYDISEKDSLYTSANYLSALAFQEAGITMSPYQKFLIKLSESVPAMNIHGYLGANNQWYNYEIKSPYVSLLSDYRIIQYNNIFEKQKYWEWFEK